MQIQKEQRDSWLVVHLNGRLDADTTAEFSSALAECLDTGSTRIVVNCKDLAYISSAGLRGMLNLAKKLAAAKGKLHFCGLSGMVKEVFDISGFTDVFVIKDDVDAACQE
jgi:anti-anti-sigma factor